MNKYFIKAIVLGLTSTMAVVVALAQAPTFQLDAPETANEHTLARVKAVGAVPGDVYVWDVINEDSLIDFEPYKKSKPAHETGIIFTGKPGRYLVRSTLLRDDVLTSSSTYVTIARVGPVPTPPGPTPPGPTPPGPTPPGPQTDEVAKATLTALALLPPVARGKIPGVLAAYRNVISKAESLDPAYATIQQIQAELQVARSAAMGDPASWAGWSDIMKLQWDSFWLRTGGKPTRMDVLGFHKSVALGLSHAPENN